MTRLSAAVSADDHQLGPEDASVVLVEYGDFQSADCADAHDVLRKLLDRRTDVLFVFRHFPDGEANPTALSAAHAAEAAARQHAFWDMHDLLFENQETLSENLLYELAQRLDFDMDAFEGDMKHHSTAKRVQKHMLGGARSGVEHTPALFINGVSYDGPIEEEAIELALEAAATT